MKTWMTALLAALGLALATPHTADAQIFKKNSKAAKVAGKAAGILKDKGAKSVRAVATHAVLSGKAYENIEKSALDEVVFTDSIPQKQECSKIHVISVADMFAETIRNVVEHKSISDHFLL